MLDNQKIAECIEKMRGEKPHIHCVTNAVAQNFTANVMLAAGCTPSMTIAPSEVVEFVEKADGVLINLGTMDQERQKAIDNILPVLGDTQKIWTLDPVMAHLSSGRLELARKLLECCPYVMRCNKQEADALFGTVGVEDVVKKYGTCVVLSGEVDQVFDGENIVEVRNGHEWMSRVTAMGCALNALICAFATVEEDRLLASVSALVMFGLAAEIAAEKSEGVGTFLPHFIDGLQNIKSKDVCDGAKVKWVK